MDTNTINKTHISYTDLTGQHAYLKDELLEAVSNVLDRCQFILGPEVEAFEQRFAELCGVSHAVAVNSGTDALVLALRALDVGSGDEVITVPNSFVATTSAIVLARARPVFIDVRDDYNMDPSQIESVITSRTKAILPVHLTGRPAEMNTILEIAKRHHLYVIEDAAQAVLAAYHTKRVGSFGTIGCFSLHPLKTLNACGDGGVLTTNDSGLFKRLKILRNLGLESRDRCSAWSGNSRLDTIQAAMLLVKLKYLPKWTEQRRLNAEFYLKQLGGLSEIRLPIEQSYEKCVYHTFVIRTDRRDELKSYLADNQVETAIHYPIPLHLQESAASLNYKIGMFPMAEAQANHILSLPIYPELGQEKLNRVVSVIKKFYRG